MNSKTRKLLVLVMVIGIGTAGAIAQVPGVINYQGRLVDGGAPVNGNREVVIRLFNLPAAGALLYEDSNTV